MSDINDKAFEVYASRYKLTEDQKNNQGFRRAIMRTFSFAAIKLSLSADDLVKNLRGKNDD